MHQYADHLLIRKFPATVPMSMFGSGQGSVTRMPPLVKSEPEEGLSMAGMYKHSTQAMDLAQDFPAVSGPLYDFHFSSGQPNFIYLQAWMVNRRAPEIKPQGASIGVSETRLSSLSLGSLCCPKVGAQFCQSPSEVWLMHTSDRQALVDLIS